jgi:hypothetical protein
MCSVVYEQTGNKKQSLYIIRVNLEDTIELPGEQAPDPHREE